MKGIVLISHGDMAKGMAQSATLFVGENIEQLAYCCLQKADSPDEFAEHMREAIAMVDSGEGVIILADMFGGTPCNQAAQQLNENVELIAGINFPMFVEILVGRMIGNVNLDDLVALGCGSISNVKKLLLANVDDDEDD